MLRELGTFQSRHFDFVRRNKVPVSKSHVSQILDDRLVVLERVVPLLCISLALALMTIECHAITVDTYGYFFNSIFSRQSSKVSCTGRFLLVVWRPEYIVL